MVGLRSYNRVYFFVLNPPYEVTDMAIISLRLNNSSINTDKQTKDALRIEMRYEKTRYTDRDDILKEALY